MSICSVLEPNVEPPAVVPAMRRRHHQAWYRIFSIDEMHRVDGTPESRSSARHSAGPMHALLQQGDQFLFGAQTIFSKKTALNPQRNSIV